MSLTTCPDCGREVSDTAATCLGCGRPMRFVPPEPPAWHNAAYDPPSGGAVAAPGDFHAVSITKLAVMSVCTLGLYVPFWFYRNWRRVKERENSEISPFWRAFFTPLWGFSLFDRVHDRVIEERKRAGWSPFALGVLFFLLSVTWRLPDPWWLVCLFNFLPLIPVQGTINEMSRERGVLPDQSFRAQHIAVMVAGSIVLLLAIIGSLMPPA